MRERATGIEPAFSAWEADVLPLNYAREDAPNVHAGKTRFRNGRNCARKSPRGWHQLDQAARPNTSVRNPAHPKNQGFATTIRRLGHRVSGRSHRVAMRPGAGRPGDSPPLRESAPWRRSGLRSPRRNGSRRRARRGRRRLRRPPPPSTRHRRAAMPTMGSLSALPPIDPWKTASPKEKIPPSAATSQYPPPSAVAGHAHDGRVERLAAHRPVEDGVTEGEDPAVRRHLPVPATVGRRRPCPRWAR